MTKIEAKYFKTKYVPIKVLENYSFPSHLVKPKDSFNDCAKNLLKYSLNINNALAIFEKNKMNYDNVRNNIENKDQINPKLKIRKKIFYKDQYDLELKKTDEDDYFSDIDSIKELTDVNIINEGKQRLNTHCYIKTDINECIEQRKRKPFTFKPYNTITNAKNKHIPLEDDYRYMKKYKTSSVKYNNSLFESKMRKIGKVKKEYCISINNSLTKRTQDAFNTTTKVKKRPLLPIINNPNDKTNRDNADLNYSKEHKTNATTFYNHKPKEISLRYLLLQNNEE